MTQPPNQFPPPPLPAQPYYGPVEPPKLHGAAKVFAIIAIVLGSIGLLGICGLPQYFVDIGPPNPVMKQIRADHVLFPFTIAATIVGIIISAFLLFGGIKSLKLDPRGRATLVYVSIIQVVFCLVGIVIGMLYTLPIFRALARQHPNDPAWIGGVIGAYFGVAISFVSVFFYCVMAYIFTRPEVKAQFEPPTLPGQP